MKLTFEELDNMTDEEIAALPEDTEFVLYEPTLKRDPVTGQLIPPEPYKKTD